MSASADSSAFPSLGYSYPSKLQSQMVNNWGLQTGNHIMPTPYSPSPTPSYLMGGLADPNRAVDYVTFDPATGYPLVQGDTGSLAALQHNITTYIGNVFPNTPVSVGTNIYKLITAPTGSQYYQTQSFTGTKVSMATPHRTAPRRAAHALAQLLAAAAPLPLSHSPALSPLCMSACAVLHKRLRAGPVAVGRSELGRHGVPGRVRVAGRRLAGRQPALVRNDVLATRQRTATAPERGGRQLSTQPEGGGGGRGAGSVQQPTSGWERRGAREGALEQVRESGEEAQKVDAFECCACVVCITGQCA